MGKAICPFHLSFLMTAESVWGLGGKFVLIPSYPPTSTQQICRDCRHEIHLNTYERKNNLMGPNLFPGRENQTTLLKSVGNCLLEQKLFTEVKTGAKSHFPWCCLNFCDLRTWLCSFKVWLYSRKSNQNGEFVFSLTRKKTCLYMVTTTDIWEKTPFSFPLTKA